MALTLVKNISDTITLGLWKIEESVNDLKNQLNLEEDFLNSIDKITLDKRKIELLCVRILIQKILGNTVFIDYLDSGKPILKNTQLSVSISHSKDFVGTIIGRKEEVGIDIECIGPKVEKIKNKFLRNDELQEIPSGDTYLKQLLLYWCAKESLMKISGNRGIDFKTQLRVFPFTLSNEGHFTGEIIENNSVKRISLNYFENSDNLIVWGSYPK